MSVRNDDLHYDVVVVMPSKNFAANRLFLNCIFSTFVAREEMLRNKQTKINHMVNNATLN